MYIHLRIIAYACAFGNHKNIFFTFRLCAILKPITAFSLPRAFTSLSLFQNCLFRIWELPSNGWKRAFLMWDSNKI